MECKNIAHSTKASVQAKEVEPGAFGVACRSTPHRNGKRHQADRHQCILRSSENALKGSAFWAFAQTLIQKIKHITDKLRHTNPKHTQLPITKPLRTQGRTNQKIIFCIIRGKPRTTSRKAVQNLFFDLFAHTPKSGLSASDCVAALVYVRS